jgi:hypothetical protein
MDTTRILRTAHAGIKSDYRDGFKIFRIRCDIASRHNLETLTETIETALKEGTGKIALSVTADSYLYSEIIAHIIRYSEIVCRYGGEFCLIEDDAHIRDILNTIGLTRLVRVVDSEDKIGARSG